MNAGICLIFPPLIKTEACPPAGIPSLVAYLKARGHNTSVLDMDLVLKKCFLIYRIRLYIQRKLFSFQKIVLRKTGSVDKVEGKRSYKKFRILIKPLKKIGLFVLSCTVKMKQFNEQPPPLEYVIETFKNKTRIERLLRPALKQVKGRKIVGISVMYPNQILYALIIAKLVKEMGDVFVVLGGSQITAHIHKLTNSLLLDYVDGFIVHEGEQSLYALVDGEDFRRIPNFYYKDGDSYRPSDNVDFVMPMDCWEIPDFDEFDLTVYPQRALPIRTLRGCFWGKCRFCSYPYISGKFNLSSSGFVIENIKGLQQKYGIDNFEFIDSSLPARFLKLIAEGIIKNNLVIQWHCRVDCEDAFKDPGFAKLLKQSGCRSLALGVESGNNRIIRYMNKLQKDKETVIEVVKTLRSAGITIVIFAMVGFPTETKAEINETIDLVMKLKDEYQVLLRNVSIFNLLEHTYVYDNPQEFKITKIYKRYHNAAQGYGFHFECPDGASKKETRLLCKKANLFLKYPFLYKIYQRRRIRDGEVKHLRNASASRI